LFGQYLQQIVLFPSVSKFQCPQHQLQSLLIPNLGQPEWQLVVRRATPRNKHRPQQHPKNTPYSKTLVQSDRNSRGAKCPMVSEQSQIAPKTDQLLGAIKSIASHPTVMFSAKFVWMAYEQSI
jgi:hypothetical protein